MPGKRLSPAVGRNVIEGDVLDVDVRRIPVLVAGVADAVIGRTMFTQLPSPTHSVPAGQHIPLPQSRGYRNGQ